MKFLQYFNYFFINFLKFIVQIHRHTYLRQGRVYIQNKSTSTP